jgi:hypothetical protein
MPVLFFVILVPLMPLCHQILGACNLVNFGEVDLKVKIYKLKFGYRYVTTSGKIYS